ncbi:MAG: hypothetical protein AAF658_17760, partial [Myxococcota bacterium]
RGSGALAELKYCPNPPAPRLCPFDGIEESPHASCAPLELEARKTYNPSTFFDAQWCGASTQRFVLPAEIPVTSGNAGNHWIDVRFHADGETVSCRYRGGADQAHPEGDTQVSKGLRYVFLECSAELAPGTVVAASAIEVHLANGDSFLPDTQVRLSLLPDSTCGGSP